MPIKIASEIAQILSDYAKATAEEVERTADEVAKDTVKELKASGAYSDRTGEYRKSFKVKKAEGRFIGKIVYSEKHYRLTHLLEHGHVNRDGSRTPGFPHWAPAEEKAMKDYEEKLRRAIEGIRV